MNGTTFEFVWRIGITVLALIGLAVFWYVVLSVAIQLGCD
jgi:hypothetical protein